MPADPNRPRKILIRALLLLLSATLLVLLFLWADPAALSALLSVYLPPGLATVPDFGPTPLPPTLDAPRASPPTGPLALTGSTSAGPFGCGFLLQLPDGRRAGVSTAHSTQPLPASLSGQFLAPDGTLAATVIGQLQIGQTFQAENFTSDYALWSLAPACPGPFLQPDPRGLAQPGERVWLYAPSSDAQGQPQRWAGTILRSSPSAGWLQTDTTFDPRGYSGCPILSQHTGQLIGMAVAGLQQPATALIALHPAASLAQKVASALK